METVSNKEITTVAKFLSNNHITAGWAEVRRLIAQNVLKIDGNFITSFDQLIDPTKPHKVEIGKRIKYDLNPIA